MNIKHSNKQFKVKFPIITVFYKKLTIRINNSHQL